MFLIFILVSWLLIWLLTGAAASWALVQCSNCKLTDKKLRRQIWRGFFWALEVIHELGDEWISRRQGTQRRRPRRLLYSDEDMVWLYRPDLERHNPFDTELEEARAHLHGLRGLPGEAAQKERARLARHITYMRAEPARLRQEPIDGFVAGVKPDYDALESRIHEKMELYAKARRETLAEMSDETQETEEGSDA
jgi:hypothetical protein